MMDGYDYEPSDIEKIEALERRVKELEGIRDTFIAAYENLLCNQSGALTFVHDAVKWARGIEKTGARLKTPGTFSRGPWRIDEPYRWIARGAPEILDADGQKIGMALHWTGSENNPLPNAYLMAAAPDLLDALNEARAALVNELLDADDDNGPELDRIIQKCDAAIVYARGT